ncbi:hypothetical protein [Labrenzia sp. PHM005]|uniref:hypothetical protein n=1 Tax=Labrenzia sp. PHM005 TaxID=2590016 RepID=UPI00114035E9|nr:hypothetical protein [Labrenzia sp. PHM005]QDG74828.1 hypothetical protein FJ695_02505 [Labrenzia sp. PHM005]
MTWVRVFLILGCGLFLTIAVTVTVVSLSSGPALTTTGFPSLPQDGETPAVQKIFISGHSLTDRPMPEMLAAIAKSSGQPVTWNMQHIGGSSIKQRSHGLDDQSPWSGYSDGTDRDGAPINVLETLAASPAEDTQPYDVFLITEQHRLLDSLVWQETPRFLRAYQDVYHAHNPTGQSYFYAPWLDVANLEDPSSWITYERKAWPVWQCAVATVNAGLANDGREDRIMLVPASLALADLVEQLTSAPAGLPGFKDMPAQDILAALFSDSVHLTPLGNSFMAAIVYGTLSGRSIPQTEFANLPDDQSATLQDIANRFITTYRTQMPTFGESCTEMVPPSFKVAYPAYTEEMARQSGTGFLKARLQRLKETLSYFRRL